MGHLLRHSGYSRTAIVTQRSPPETHGTPPGHPPRQPGTLTLLDKSRDTQNTSRVSHVFDPCLQCLSSLYSIPNGPNSRTLISSFFFISSIYCYRTTYTRTLLAKSLMPIGKFFRHTIHLSSRFKNIIGRVSKMVFLNLLQARPKISKWRIFEACKLSLLER